MPKLKDITGLKFNRLTVIKRVSIKGRKHMVECLCDCGNTKITAAADVKRGSTRSCGCLQKEKQLEYNQIHGDHGSKLYMVWGSMLQRCLNIKNKNYHRYGGRGITVCEDWLEYKNFRTWSLITGYAENLTIERKDNNLNYSPANCKWATVKEQSFNKRTTLIFEIRGEKLNTAQIREKYKIGRSNLYHRIYLGKKGEDLIK